MFGGAAWRTPPDDVSALKVFISTEKVHASNTPNCSGFWTIRSWKMNVGCADICVWNRLSCTRHQSYFSLYVFRVEILFQYISVTFHKMKLSKNTKSDNTVLRSTWKTWCVWKRCKAGDVYPNLKQSGQRATHVHFRMLAREEKDAWNKKKK